MKQFNYFLCLDLFRFISLSFSVSFSLSVSLFSLPLSLAISLSFGPILSWVSFSILAEASAFLLFFPAAFAFVAFRFFTYCLFPWLCFYVCLLTAFTISLCTCVAETKWPKTEIEKVRWFNRKNQSPSWDFVGIVWATCNGVIMLVFMFSCDSFTSSVVCTTQIHLHWNRFSLYSLQYRTCYWGIVLLLAHASCFIEFAYFGEYK